jgi:hypothetical protein
VPHLLNFITKNGTLDPNHHTVLISHTANGILTADGENAPAPWVPYTRAGCDVGAYSMAKIMIERTPFDVNKAFGNPSPEASDPSQFTNYTGIAVHCAKGSAICGNASTKTVDDLLPQEPGGYDGFKAIFGAKYLNQVVQLKDIDGNPITGFAGFSQPASETLGAIATMQEAGIPIAISYIADAHEDRVHSLAFGPGEAGYVTLLQSYDAAFEKFFARLKSDGIDQTNTLFILTSEEGDHFAGGAPSPANCDGVYVPCTYSELGELDVNLNSLIASQKGNNTNYSIHFDMAPTVSIIGNPAYNGPVVRKREQDMSSTTVVNPYTNRNEPISSALADPVEMGLLHMITADPARTPTFTMFGMPDYFFQSSGSIVPTPGPGFARNHGGIQPEIAQLWLGMVGSGVLHLGASSGYDRVGTDLSPILFSDHTDIRPTMLALLGLKDDYTHDGRALFEVLNPSALPRSLTSHAFTLLQMAQVYKAINAPFGDLGQTSLHVSTAALASDTTNDATYTALEAKIASWRKQRDSLANRMQSILEGAAFDGKSPNDFQALLLAWQGLALLGQVHACERNIPRCAQQDAPR